MKLFKQEKNAEKNALYYELRYFRAPAKLALISGAGIAGLAALIPIITIKQRMTHPNDWISTDHEVACPDIHCGGVFKISRIGKKTFHHHQVTATRS